MRKLRGRTTALSSDPRNMWLGHYYCRGVYLCLTCLHLESGAARDAHYVRMTPKSIRAFFITPPTVTRIVDRVVITPGVYNRQKHATLSACSPHGIPKYCSLVSIFNPNLERNSWQD